MPLRVSVLIPPAAADARSLLSSLDRQSLSASDFEVLVGDDEQAPALTTRLDDLAAHRTNLARVPVAAGADVAATLLERARGEYVLAVAPGRTLSPDALALLCDRADATHADVCLGLTGRPGARAPRLAAGPDRLADAAGGIRRRTSARSEQVAADLTGADATVEGAAVVATALCFVDGPVPDRGVPAETDRSVTAGTTSVTWSAGVLEVVAELTEVSSDVVAGLYCPQTGVEWPLPDVQVDGSAVTLRIDPAAVPGPGRIDDGIWWPSLRIGGRAPVLIETRPRDAHGATLGDRVVVSFSGANRLGLDVGARHHQPIRRLRPARTTVVEDSRGSLLTCSLRNVDIASGDRHTGELGLGGMPVVAWIEHLDGTGTVLRAWVSGLAGASTLHTRFSRAPFALTGSRLVIDGVGAMSVEAIPREPATDGSERGEPGDRPRRFAGRAPRAGRRPS